MTRVVICGAGVIGACTAYFLAKHGVETVVVERTAPACAASGKSGGFLALDWCDGSPLEPLARHSFALHERLADDLGIDWGYRRLDTLSVYARQGRDLSAYNRMPHLDWLAEGVAMAGRLGTTETTAQVHPGQFTRGMLDAACKLGATVRIGTVNGIETDPSGTRVTGVMVGDDLIGADALVIAMGPWSILATQWLPLPMIYGLKGHSLVFKYQPKPGPDALFVDYESAGGDDAAPEVFPRPDGTTYVCGLSSDVPLPIDPNDVGPDPGGPEKLRAMIADFAPDLANAEILHTQACYRPATRDTLPLIGAIPGLAGAYVATGHNVWGILNGPATGEAMADLIATADGPALDLSPFDPSRLSPA